MKNVQELRREGQYGIPLMHADMHNLAPSIGAVNALRSNFNFAMLPGVESTFGSCEMKIEGKRVEPPEAARGIIARTYLYMQLNTRATTWADLNSSLWRHGTKCTRRINGNVHERSVLPLFKATATELLRRGARKLVFDTMPSMAVRMIRQKLLSSVRLLLRWKVSRSLDELESFVPYKGAF